ncbi:MAG TPA: septal ring lytic transglycosylase RlpA family protein [Kofleriaceae bacterium]|nr:septal ring lytic transglycosylase RlpA family protein [Kofleriaceae bacterium]
MRFEVLHTRAGARTAIAVACAGAIAAGSGCREKPTPPPPADAAPAEPVDRVVRVLRGSAVWYGADWHGKRTASGERFDRHDLTAAHRTLPLGTRVRVTDVASGRKVVVRINDRGPYGPNRRRVIDLSEAAARQLGFAERGSTRVKLEVLEARDPAAAGPADAGVPAGAAARPAGAAARPRIGPMP